MRNFVPDLSKPRPGGFWARAYCHFLAIGGLVLVLTGILPSLPRAYAQSSLSEPQVKALFLFNFAKYVEWPAEAFSGPSAPITIGIVGDSPCAEYLQKTIEGKTVSERPIVFKLVEKTADMERCQILFIGESEKKRLEEVLAQLKGQPVLTVGESEQFAQRNGMIGFVKREGRVRLAINLAAARRAKLEISSKLLSVADDVIGK